MGFLRILLCLVLWALPVGAEVRALLIGVAKYDPRVGLADLKGPPNDVRLLRDTLAARGVGDIRVLADGVQGRPTHAAIQAAFAGLARDSVAGDVVFISMSGHGTQQADLNGDEADGLDEVFLPADVQRVRWLGRVIPRALVDDEIGAAVLAIRQKGADVVLVMDSCHSGSGMRDASGVVTRGVDPAVLGVVAVPRGAAGSVLEAEPDAPGQVVAFYAARSDELAHEVNMTPGVEGGWYGLFTARLAARLARAEGVSYRQLFQGVLADMNDLYLPGGGPLQTPAWEGGLIDAAVLGGRTTSGLRQFAVRGDEVAAGLVQGFGLGTVFGLVGDAADPAGVVLGYGQVEAVEATRGYLRAVGAGCVPRAEVLCDAVGPLPEARFARLVARPVDEVLRMARVRDRVTGQERALDDPLVRALGAAVQGVPVEMVAQGAQVEVVADGDRLWFGRRAVLGDVPVGLSWASGDGVELAALVQRMVAAERLAWMLGSVVAEGSALDPSPVEVTADLAASRLADLDPPGQGGNPVRECRRALARARGVGVDLASGPVLKQCDQVSLAVQGVVAGARDVNRIHIDSQYCVHAAHARVEGDTRPVALGLPMIICSDCPDGVAAGDERLFVITTEAEANADQLNLEGLVETCEAAPTRGAAGGRAVAFLEALGKGREVRGAFGGMAVSGVWVEAWGWQVLPKALAFARGQ